MRFYIPITLTAIGLLMSALATSARAQADVPFGPENYDCDLQLFAPVEIDLNDQPYHDDHGYFFKYDRLLWSFSGEKVLIGDPTITYESERIYYQNPGDLGTITPPYTIVNGIEDAYPNAGVSNGNRFELGYNSCEGAGWAITALQGPNLNQHNVFGGFGDQQSNTSLVGEGNLGQTSVLGANNTPIPTQTSTNPPLDPDYTNAAGTGSGGFAAPGDKAFGFGSVHVNFQTPPGYLFGFRDYTNFLAGAALGTQGGPTLYVGNYGRTAEPNTATTTIPFFRLADDLNGNGIQGQDPATLQQDFGDLHQFNVAFERLEVRNNTRTDGVEALRTQELSNRHYMAKNQNNHFEFSYGARYFKLYDNFRVDAFGSFLGKSYWDTTYINDIVGPELALKWINQRQRWQLSADTRFTFGYNIQNWSQSNGIGQELIPGALNRPIYAQPTFSHHTLAGDDFSPLGDLRLETAYYLTQNFSLKLGYEGMYVGNIRRAATSVKYFLPDMGYVDAGSQNLLVNGVNFGVEFVH
jgi:Putative beta barrel porin-7 (BBP7)